MKLALGLDTSCYTTSVALMRQDGTLAADARRPLVVKPGGRGLSQSEMVYQHTRNLPMVFADAMATVGEGIELLAVGASVKPRPVEDSYMPAFLVGGGYGKVLALSHGVACHGISHQENHILAGIWSAGGPCADRFLAVHVSGGTTEVTAVDSSADGLTVTLLGGSLDIAAGQFIDRIGVTLGLPFPAGPEIERLARHGQDNPAAIPVTVEKCSVSFSGPETHARRLLDQGFAPAFVAAGLQRCIAEALTKMIRAAITATKRNDVLLVGGVGSNSYIRGHIAEGLAGDRAVSLYYPRIEYSGDNAVGAAYYALSH